MYLYMCTQKPNYTLQECSLINHRPSFWVLKLFTLLSLILLSLFSIQIMSNIIYMKLKKNNHCAFACVHYRDRRKIFSPSLTTKLTVDFPKMICGLCGLYVYIGKKYVSQIRKKMFFSSQVLKEKKMFSCFYLIFIPLIGWQTFNMSRRRNTISWNTHHY